MNAYKFGLPASEIPPYYGHYVVNDYLPRNDISRRAWEYPTMSYNEQPTATEIQAEENSVATMEAIPEECQSYICSVLILQINKHVVTLQIKNKFYWVSFKSINFFLHFYSIFFQVIAIKHICPLHEHGHVTY